MDRGRCRVAVTFYSEGKTEGGNDDVTGQHRSSCPQQEMEDSSNNEATADLTAEDV